MLLAGFAGYSGSEATLRGQVSSALQLLVHVSRLPGGERRVMSISEVLGDDEQGLVIRPAFRFDLAQLRHHDLRAAGEGAA